MCIIKKVLFSLFCVLACIGFVYARDVSDLKEQWHLKLDDYNHQFGFDDKYIYYTYETEISLIDKNTGEQITVDLEDDVNSILSHNNYIYVKTDTKLFKFDKELNVVKSRELGIYKNLLRSPFVYEGKMYSMGSYTRDSFIIGDNLEISSLFKYEDGSFIVMDDSHTYLLNKDEKIIGQFDEIDGYYMKTCIYLNNSYYILSTNSRYDRFSGGNSIIAKLRKLDSSFNLIVERDFEITNDYLKTMFVYDNKLILNNYLGNKSFLISEDDLSETAIDYISSSLGSYNYNSPVIEYKGNSTYYGNYEFYIESERHLYSDEEEMVLSLNIDNLITDMFRKNNEGEYLFLGHIEDTTDYIISAFDANGNVVFFTVLPDLDSTNVSATFFGEYIAVYLEKTEKGIIIYNRDGDVVHSLVVDKSIPDEYFVELYGQNNGLTLLYGYPTNIDVPRISLQTSYLNDNTKVGISYHKEEIVHYNFDPMVEAKVEGNGSVNINTADYKPGDVVSFESLPKSGYVVSKVIVKDEYGNEIEVKDNSFVMPNADVTIEVVFDVVNPNTGVFLTFAVLCILAFVLYFFILQNKMNVKKFE